MTATDIQKGLESSKMEDKVKALKSLVINIINDEQAPRMIMNVINTLVPIQNESHDLKKILLFYWEVIEKVQANGNLKDEMILVCNSLRNDLLHPNEYIRGRTLKLLSRIQHRVIIDSKNGLGNPGTTAVGDSGECAAQAHLCEKELRCAPVRNLPELRG